MFLTRLPNFRFDAASEGGGGAADGAAAAKSGTALAPGEINLSDPAFEKLGLPAGLRKTPLANGPAKASGNDEARMTNGEPAATASAKTSEEAEAAKAETELAARAEAAGNTVEEQRAEEETAAATEQERLEARATELGKTVEEVLALEAEEAKASVAPEMNQEQSDYVQALVTEHEQLLGAEKSRADQAEARAQQLEADLQGVKRPPVAVLGIHPIFLAVSEADIAAADAQFAQFEQWCLKNWDGSAEVPAQGDQAAIPAFTGEQIRQRYAQVKEQRAQMVPKAKEALAVRTGAMNQAKEIYPALFDSKRPESRVVNGYLSQYPELSAIMPNFHVIAGDAIFGEAIRKAACDPKSKGHAAVNALLKADPALGEMLKVKPAASRPGKPGTTNFKLPPKPGAGKAPGKVPRPNGSPAGRVAAASTKTATGPSTRKLGELRRSGMSERDALTSMISGISLPTLAPAAGS